MVRTVMHIGVGKAGTTSLQNNIFANLPEADCLWRPNHQTDDCRIFSLGIRMAEDYRIDPMCMPFVERVRASTKDTIILSDETIRSEVDSLAAARLARYFPDAHILITVRNQFTALPSYYRDTGRMITRSPVAGRNLFVSWPEFIEYTLEQHHRSSAREFKYYDLAKAYAQHFENVTVLVFEEMVESPETYFGKLAPVVGSETKTLLELSKSAPIGNPGESGRSLHYMNFRSRLPIKQLPIPDFIRRAGWRYLYKGRKADVNVTEANRAAISALYAEGNRALEREFSTPLSDYGYPL